MWFVSARLFGAELCLTRSEIPFVGFAPRAQVFREGELYLHWLDLELVLSLVARVERRRRICRPSFGAARSGAVRENESVETDAERGSARRAPS